MFCRRLDLAVASPYSTTTHDLSSKAAVWLGSRWRGYNYGKSARATYPHGPSAAACTPVVQLSRGRDPYSWAGSAPQHGHFASVGPFLQRPSNPPARVFAGLGGKFFPASHSQSRRSFRSGALLPDSCPALPWRGLALFKRRARIGPSRASGGPERGGGWLGGLAGVGFALLLVWGRRVLRAWAMV